MDEIYKKLAEAGQLATSAGNLALEFDNNARACDTYEVWVHNDSKEVVQRFPRIESTRVRDWLEYGGDSDANPGHTLLLRLVLVTIHTMASTKKKTVSMAKETHGQLLKAFGLQLANEFLKGTITSVTAFPKVEVAPDADLYCYSFNHAPKLAAIWSQVRCTGVGPNDKQAPTQGVIYMTEENGASDAADHGLAEKAAPAGVRPGDVLRKLLGSPFCADLYSNSMAPALLLALQLGFEIDVTQSRIKTAISEIEGKTGYHIFESRVRAATTPDERGLLAVQASGSATKLASVDRKSASMQKVLQFIVKELDKQGPAEADSPARKAQELLRHHVGVLEERLEMQMLNTRYTMKRVDIQINAAQIFNMITQEDSLNGIIVAKNGNELAKSTHQIAHASYRDSSSMKTLAIVTMFFLPGSFVSAMFSMPVFEWTRADPGSPAIGVGMLPQFGLYWVITLPLTMATFCLYFAWLLHLKRKSGREFVTVSRKLVDNQAILARSAGEPGMAAPASGGPVPAQLGFLAIYNPSLGMTDDTIDDQIVYYSSVTLQTAAPSKRRRARTRGRPTEGISPEERNERLRQIGLAQGMVSFGQGFTDGAPVDSIETETTRVIVHELESGWWILAEEKYDYNTKEMKPASLILRDLQRAYRTFLMHHDVSLSSLFLRIPRPKFVAILGRYWDLFLSTWNVLLHGNPARDMYQGINIAASGELGVGVGEEDRGSGEREVLEGLVGRTEGLVDLVVSKFGSEDDDAAEGKGNTAPPWLGSGREPSVDDGAIFLGIGALSRESLRDVTHWVEDLYTWGEHAYGIIESPTSTRKARAKKAGPGDADPKASEVAAKGVSQTRPPLVSVRSSDSTIKGRTAQKSNVPTANIASSTAPARKTEEAGGDPASEPQAAEADDGKLDKMVSYLKLGYGQYWTIPGVSGLSGSSTEQPGDEKEHPASKTGDGAAPKRPPMPKQTPSQEAAGHYLIGLKGEIEEAHDGGYDDGGAASDESESEHDSRTVLRTIHVELEDNDTSGQPRQPTDTGGATLTEAQMRGNLRPGASVRENSKSEKLRVVVYVNRPFVFVFLFRLRTDSLAWDALYRSLHYQLSPLRKPLLASTRYRPERPETDRGSSGGGVSASGIYNLVWNPLDLTVHTTVPNIPDHLYPADDHASAQRWSRADAVNTHLHVLNLYTGTRSPRVTDLERTQKTSRGWWVVWTRLVQREAGSRGAVQQPPTARDSPATSAPPSPRPGSEADEEVGPTIPGLAITSKEIFLIRRASDHVSSGSGSLVGGGGGVDAVGRLAQGIGVDTRRYVEDLLSML
ncbi:hypothetical protein LLEC1_05838 [Akanthomyces lecanii]|uniref:CCZ1/INTU/HSP4 first Longin domain-containing protein n=1 Tax=Cordyceps confragosa TaxID=2714763 RepID=A0A179I5T0_CORDF|nr:hypothetical protein LLEC1_05838 [Akanthomyces lecanii]